jgi:hypothetical protein
MRESRDVLEQKLYIRCAELRHRSAKLCTQAAALQRASTDLVVRVDLLQYGLGGAIYDAPVTSAHDAALEALRLIRTIIDPLPIKWQVAIVRALTARTIVKAKEQTRPSTSIAMSA